MLNLSQAQSVVIVTTTLALSIVGCGNADTAPASVTTVTETVTQSRSPLGTYYEGDGGANGYATCDSQSGSAKPPVTSCPFAINVAAAYLSQPRAVLYNMYSPTTDRTYTMHCTEGFEAVTKRGQVLDVAQCVNDTNAVVLVFL